eukprot:CAMPEP_0182441918 /NCGR_PEP_ID=MMETSP1172-20130603/902_1 /TAXON_ID=708627 /ORGANISM="Timspurckia oligopyrenoides, Strain CCMP3278" /LENGTH=1470 /DNA_ID=CAMNT_0024636515 /DNA_START=157 /DNA_END=4569 /DNA_ORIENTATION=-
MDELRASRGLHPTRSFQKSTGLKKLLHRVQFIFLLLSLIPFILVTIQYANQKPVFQIEAIPIETLKLPPFEICSIYGLPNVPPKQEFDPFLEELNSPFRITNSLFEVECFKDPMSAPVDEELCTRQHTQKYTQTFWKSLDSTRVSVQQCEHALGSRFHYNLEEFTAEIELCRSCVSISQELPTTPDRKNITSMTIKRSPTAQCFSSGIGGGGSLEGSYEDVVISSTVMLAIVRHYWNEFIDLGVLEAPRDLFQQIESVIHGQYEVFYELIPSEMFCDLILYSGLFYETQFENESMKYTFDFVSTSFKKSGDPLKYWIASSSDLVPNLDVFYSDVVVDEEHLQFGDVKLNPNVIGIGQSMLLTYSLEKDADGHVGVEVEVATRARKEFFEYGFEFIYENAFMTVVSVSYAESGIEYFNNAFGYFSLFAGLTIFSMLTTLIQCGVWIKNSVSTTTTTQSEQDEVIVVQNGDGFGSDAHVISATGWKTKSRFRMWVLRYMDVDGDGRISESEKAASVLALCFVLCLIASTVLMILATIEYVTQNALVSIEKKTFGNNDFLIPNLLFCTQSMVAPFETKPKRVNDENLQPTTRATCVTHQSQEYCGNDLDQLIKRVWRKPNGELLEALNNSFESRVQQCGNGECESCYLYERGSGLESSVNPSNAFTFSVEWSAGFKCCFQECEGCCDTNLFQVVLDSWDELVQAGIINDFGNGTPEIGQFWRLIGGRFIQKIPICDIVYSSGFFFEQPRIPVRYNWNAQKLVLEIADDSAPSRFPLKQSDAQAMKVYSGLEPDFSDLVFRTLMSMGTDEFLIIEENASVVKVRLNVENQTEAFESHIVDARILKSYSQRSGGVFSKYGRELAGYPSINYTLTVFHESIDYEVITTRYPYQFLEYLNDLGGFIGNFTGLSVFGIFFYVIPWMFRWIERKKAEKVTRNARHNDENSAIERDLNFKSNNHGTTQTTTVDGDVFHFEPVQQKNGNETERENQNDSSLWTRVFDVDGDGKVTSVDVYICCLITIFLLMLIAMIVACGFLIVEFINSPSFLSYQENTIDASVATLPPILICSANRGSNLAAKMRNDRGTVLGLSRVGRGTFSSTFDESTEYFDEEWNAQHVQSFIQTESSSQEECRGIISTVWRTQFGSDCRYCVRLGDEQAGLKSLTGFVEDNELVVDFISDYYYSFCFTGAFQIGVATRFYRTHELKVFKERRQELLDAGKIRIDDGSPLEKFGEENFGLDDQMLCNLVYFSDIIYETDIAANFTVVKNGNENYTFLGDDVITKYATNFKEQQAWDLENDLEIFIVEENETNGNQMRELRYLGEAAPDDQLVITLSPQVIDGITQYSWQILTHPLGAADASTGLYYIRMRFVLESDTVVTLTTTPSYQWLQFVTDLFGFPGFFVGLAFFNGVYILVIVLYSRKHSDEKARMEALNRFDDSQETRDVDMFDTKKVGRDHRFNIRALLFTFDVLSRIKA